MIPKKNISTIEEIEAEQAKLRLTMAVTKQEFDRSLSAGKIETKDFLLKKIAIPAGAVGLGLAATKKMTSSKKEEKNGKALVRDNNSLLNSLIPLGLSIFEAFVLKKQKKESNEKQQTYLQTVA